MKANNELDKNREFMHFCDNMKGLKIIKAGREISKAAAFWAGMHSTQIKNRKIPGVIALPR